MKKNLIKLSAGVGALLSSLYWASLPVLAGNNVGVNLCEGPNAKLFCFNSTVPDIVNTIINLILFIAFIAALVFLIFGGIRWIMSGGDKEATGKAKGTVTSALIGLAVVLGAWILINLVVTFFGGGSIQNIVFPTLNRI